jgi:mannosyltransferase OCH1-like enzyme
MPLEAVGLAIPKLIHQTTHDKDWVRNHPVLREAISELLARNPGWAYRLYDDEDARAFIRARYGDEMCRTFDRINPAYGPARADFFRYLLLFDQGGIYLDLKSTATLPLDEVLTADDEYILSHWRNKPGEQHAGWGLHPVCGPAGEFQQWHVIAAPGHRYLEAVIARVVANIAHYDGAVGKSGVLYLTGPVPYTLAIQPLLASCRHRLVDIDRLGFRYNMFSSYAERMVPGRTHYIDLKEPIILPA